MLILARIIDMSNLSVPCDFGDQCILTTVHSLNQFVINKFCV